MHHMVRENNKLVLAPRAQLKENFCRIELVKTKTIVTGAVVYAGA